MHYQNDLAAGAWILSQCEGGGMGFTMEKQLEGVACFLTAQVPWLLGFSPASSGESQVQHFSLNPSLQNNTQTS